MENLTNIVSEHEWVPLFLRVLRSVGILREAADAVGVTTLRVRALMRRNAAFAQEVYDAQEDATGLLESIAWKRAMNGDTLLLMFLLKAANPGKYREKTTLSAGPTINVKAYVGFSPDQWDQVVDSTAQVIDDRSEADQRLQAPVLADSAPAQH